MYFFQLHGDLERSITNDQLLMTSDQYQSFNSICKKFFVLSVSLNRSSIRMPTSQVISFPLSSTQMFSLSVSGILLSVKKSLIFLRWSIPSGTKRSPCCHLRNVRGNFTLAASRQAMVLDAGISVFLLRFIFSSVSLKGLLILFSEALIFTSVISFSFLFSEIIRYS